MFVDGQVFSDPSNSDRTGESSARLTMKNLEKYSDMLSRLKQADEVTGKESQRDHQDE